MLQVRKEQAKEPRQQKEKNPTKPKVVSATTSNTYILEEINPKERGNLSTM